MQVQQEIDIVVYDDGDLRLPQIPCSEASKALSWKAKPPRGFWSTDHHWTSLLCTQPEVTLDWLNRCLEDTTVWLYGDSNAKQVFKALKRWIPRESMKGFGADKNHGINIFFVKHELPVYSNSSLDVAFAGGVGTFVDKIPETGRHFVFFHYFLHTSRAHLSSLFLRLKALRTHMVRLLDKNPHVHIAVRGAHTSALQVLRNHMLGGDVLGTFVNVLYREMFRDLSDRVVFLDDWDMTIALENPDYHPIPQVAEELARTFFAFKCS